MNALIFFYFIAPLSSLSSPRPPPCCPPPPPFPLKLPFFFARRTCFSLFFCLRCLALFHPIFFSCPRPLPP
ncbi:hypothetical protein BC940DRAFT_295593 [Gongronella butleri]|nr:hypothetical protein BC940DRAFT_295593 [Gongronella butleri]